MVGRFRCVVRAVAPLGKFSNFAVFQVKLWDWPMAETVVRAVAVAVQYGQ